ncbi:CorA family divalent cation transporter [Streptomyces sp. NBC_00513]|uniref:magnesium transporter CorA family protein n=1 Tax=unclassified Streptomyces TaxID=2593676 RepID=UPI001F3C930F|nr:MULTISPECIES: CorA family divalent cation transporter [unclassified Streptomyces]MCX5074084.1 CorA family divalent cation transporter [Streptomyces sp. NBC_00424]MCX5154363.1 CorA family divalent cation transporter [Streptomyces sp. NBC_00291]WUD42711.1 CorA family divalent cation transporter [Streptomyces sp. NBC_00513]
MVSMPEGVMTRAPVSEARERLAASRFLLVDVELPEETPPDEQPLARLLGLEEEDLTWLGREGEFARAEFLGDSAAFVVPSVEAGRIIHLHAVVTERYLLTAHRGPTGLVRDLAARFPHEKPTDAVAMLFLLLDAALESYRRAAVQALLEVEDLENDMFHQREPEQLYRLARLRRTAALLHHTLLPYHRVAEETVTRRMLNDAFPETRQRLVREYQRTARLVLTDIESLQEAARRAFGSYSSLVSGDQNGVINRLAIVSTIFLPLTFLTGFFGMNFAYLTDEIESGAVFWLLAVGLQVAFLILALYALHRTRIWRRLRDDDGRDDDA